LLLRYMSSVVGTKLRWSRSSGRVRFVDVLRTFMRHE
jgi:hypothetical protein